MQEFGDGGADFLAFAGGCGVAAIGIEFEDGSVEQSGEIAGWLGRNYVVVFGHDDQHFGFHRCCRRAFHRAAPISSYGAE